MEEMNILSLKKMMKHIISQALYQIIVTLVIIFAGDYFIPEYLTPQPDLPAYAIYSPYTNGGQHYVRSGRMWMVNGQDPDYLELLDIYGTSRHFTMVFNTFVVLQIFNFFNCRKLNDEFNIFSGVLKSHLFCGIVFIIIAGQFVLGNFGGRALNVSFHGMDIRQWLIAVTFGFGSWVMAFVVKLVPAQLFWEAGRSEADPLRHKSAVISLRRSKTNEALKRMFLTSSTVRKMSSTKSRPSYHKSNSINPSLGREEDQIQIDIYRSNVVN